DGDSVQAGRLRRWLTSASSLANVAAVGRGDVPLFLFHLLEFLDVDYELDLDTLSTGRAETEAWRVLTVRDSETAEGPMVSAPRSGVWCVDPEAESGIRFLRRETDWRGVADESEAFFLRVARKGRDRTPGSALGLVVTRGRPDDDVRAQAWIDGI